ncbi:TetR/AcrR family transcriptional regulator C-terminal ligand-binding domain-containing protein [Mycolicibacterium septicum]|nr:TetR/AcrR family transcriptional regulator C-terminal ligand-binding domain-containing protein [Mycolicibacterium septicum]QRY48603.1 TetR/AcrR family transcriptional regulator C-terminal ligand-binding domain-containing protein [Mycolicibacterium boenickei]
MARAGGPGRWCGRGAPLRAELAGAIRGQRLGRGGYAHLNPAPSKATLYKHWPPRTAVAAEAFGTMMAEALPLPDTGSTTGDLTEQVVRVSAFYASARGQVFAQLLAACVEDQTGAAYFREYFLNGRRAAITELWQRGVARDDADADIAIDDVIDILFGPLIFRRMTGHYALTEEHARRLAETALRGLAPKPG